MNASSWVDYRIFSTFVVGPEYITVLSYFKTFDDVVEEVISKMQEENKTLKPFVVLRADSLSTQDADILKEYDIPLVIME